MPGPTCAPSTAPSPSLRDSGTAIMAASRKMAIWASIGAVAAQGTGHVPHDALEAAVRQVFRLTPSGIIAMLDLARPIYRQTAAYGHFGRSDIDLSWERTDQVAALKSALA